LVGSGVGASLKNKNPLRIKFKEGRDITSCTTEE
jgi:hypothetical protein